MGTLGTAPSGVNGSLVPHFALKWANKGKYRKLTLVAGKLGRAQGSHCPKIDGHDPTKRIRPMGTLGDFPALGRFPG